MVRTTSLRCTPSAWSSRVGRPAGGAAPLWAFALSLALGVAACGGAERPVGPVASCAAAPDGTACNDGNPCTANDRCTAGVCGGPALPDGTACIGRGGCIPAGECAAGQCVGAERPCPAPAGPCETNACDEQTGQCAAAPLPDGTACVDGNPCTTDDACTTGVCRGTPLVCPAVACQGPATCDPTSGACAGPPLAAGTACDDGDPCTAGETCTAGVCGGGAETCSCRAAADGSPCDDRNACTDGDRCSAAVCAGTPFPCPDPGFACRVAACLPTTGACIDVAAPDGTACDDGDPCSQGDACLAGTCMSGPDTCFCRAEPAGTACDDGDRCTADDVCLGDVCAGQPVDCTAFSGNCTDGRCEPTSGECVAAFSPQGTPCDDTDLCTSGDECWAGRCGGTPADCTAFRDACNVGRCAAASGTCTAEPVPDGTPCDDGDPCTTSDTCTAGACGGTGDACAPCAAARAGDPCADGDPCTTDEQCVGVAPYLACQGLPTDCAPSGDACNVGVCEPSSGACAAVPHPDGGPCDDGDACTGGDACLAGRCVGTAIALCGATVAGCEPAAPNDDPGAAWPLALAEGGVRLVGFIDPPGDVDWFGLELPAGVQLSVVTAAHCGSVLDTLIGVYRFPELTLVAEAGGAGAGFAAVSDLAIPTAGAYVVGLAANTDLARGGYLVDIAVHAPVPCTDSAECGCADLECATSGPEAGRCVPALPREQEPNDAPGAATLVAVGERVYATFAGFGDRDWFALELAADASVSFATGPFCAAEAFTAVSVFSADGRTSYAYDDGRSNAGYGRIGRFDPPAAGRYLVLVDNAGLEPGRYVLAVGDQRCLVDDDCACGDARCLRAAAAPGRCEPRVPMQEGAEPVGLTLELRQHGRLDVPYDADTFALFLGPGRYDVTTGPYCGSTTDTLLAVLDADGAALAADDDSGPGPFAAVLGFSVANSGLFTLQVRGRGPTTGDYLLVVTEAPAR